MRFCSTRDGNLSVPFIQAMREGIPPDGGLFIPALIPRCMDGFIGAMHGLPFVEIASEAARVLLGDEIPEAELRAVVERAITFDAPLRRLDEHTAVLELFHGPTLAFKDFGARFMAQMMAYARRGEPGELTILVATSGDTGSAVADAFHGMSGISVVLLYPSGMVSAIQERQLTSHEGNVRALEIGGTFDDCQALVKRAFADREIAARRNLTSANSINVARLLPQTFYYFNAVASLGPENPGAVFAVPSGNLGNLTAGLIAQRMGLPVARFVAALNANDAFGRYLATGVHTPGITVPTLSNAMDVGDPGNLPRIRALFGDDPGAIRRAVTAHSISDAGTRDAIAEAYSLWGYVFDPHGAVASAALRRERDLRGDRRTGVILGTAHPAKFIDIFDAEMRRGIVIPDRLGALPRGEKRSVRLSARYDDLKSFLLQK